MGSAGSKLLCDISTGRQHPVVPVSWRRKVFDAVHDLSHPGVNTTCRLVASKFIWHGLNKQVRKWAKQCLSCQHAKVQRHVHAPLTNIPVPSRSFDHLHVDLVGPLPASQGYTHLLTIVDSFTLWPETIPLAQTDTATCARALISRWVSHYGLPAEITSDRDVQFTSQLWESMAFLFGTKLHRTTANGLVERFHRHLKSTLKARLTGPNWINELPLVLLGIRTAPKEDLGASSAEMVFGSPLTVPADFILAQPTAQQAPDQHLQRLRNTVGNLAPVPTSHHKSASPFIPHTLEVAPFVFIRRDGHCKPLQAPYDGPYKVLDRDDKTFVVDLGGRPEHVLVDRLKPAHVDLSAPVPLAQPPRRGRPPLQPAQA